MPGDSILPQEHQDAIGSPALDSVHSEYTTALERIGFRDLKALHSGTRARVYRGTDARGREVAVRVIDRHALAQRRCRPTWRNLLGWKALAWTLPLHPALVRHWDAGFLPLRATVPGDHTRTLYQSMSFISGAVLREANANPEFLAGGLQRFRDTLIAILGGLSALHIRGLRHGDLGPNNIIIRTGSWEPVIVDLRFAPRFFRRLDNDRCDIRRTIRGLLTGVFDLERHPPPLDPNRAAAHWFGAAGTESERRLLGQWADFSDALGPDGRMSRAFPPKILQEASHLACEQGH